MTVLVTGATGHVGGALTRRLTASGTPVRALSRAPGRGRIPHGAATIAGDLGDREAVARALQGIDRVFVMGPAAHLADYTSIVCEVARDTTVTQIVLLSSSAVELGGEGRLTTEHRDAEDVVRRSGIGYTFLRPGAFASNTLIWAESIRHDGRVRNPFGNAPIAPIDTDDIGAVAHAVLTDAHLGRSYLLTGPARMTPERQTEILSDVLGRPLVFEDVPADAATQTLSGVLGLGAEEAAEMVAELRRDDLPWRDPNPSVEDITGRPPATFRDWAARNADAFR